MSWAVLVEGAAVEDGKAYFLATRSHEPGKWFHLLGEGLNGKRQWTVKPGIAIRFTGGDRLRDWLRENPGQVAVIVPADADKRWKRRKKRYW